MKWFDKSSTYTLAISIAILANIPVHSWIQCLELDMQTKKKVLTLLLSIIKHVQLNLETTFTWGNSSIGRDKAGVPLSKMAYWAFCDCKSQLVLQIRTSIGYKPLLIIYNQVKTLFPKARIMYLKKQWGLQIFVFFLRKTMRPPDLIKLSKQFITIRLAQSSKKDQTSTMQNFMKVWNYLQEETMKELGKYTRPNNSSVLWAKLYCSCESYCTML
jgi:hypothetical protein